MPSVFDSLSLDTAHVAHTLCAMIQKEQEVCRTNYFHTYSLSESLLVDANARMKMVDWAFEIVDKLKLDREYVAMAMNIVDQFLSKPNAPAHVYLSSPKEFQLLSITALYTTIKIHGPMIIGPDVFAEISNSMYSVQDVEEMEMTLLTGLQWRICTPTSIQMAYHILSLILQHVNLLTLPHVNLPESSWAHLLDEILYQTDYAVGDFELSAMSRPSSVALASIMNALGEMNDDQARQEIHRALLMVIDEFGHHLASPRELLDVRIRLLHSLVITQAANHHVEDSMGQIEEEAEEDECVSIRPTSSHTAVIEYDVANNVPPRYISFEQESSLYRRNTSYV